MQLIDGAQSDESEEMQVQAKRSDTVQDKWE